MQKKRRFFASIQKRILLLTLSCILGMCILISCVSYFLFQNYLQRSLIQSTETNLQLITDTLNSSMNDVYRMVRFCQTHSSIGSYIEDHPNPDPIQAVATYDRMTDEYTNNPVSGYMLRVAVITNDDFLQIVNASCSSTANLSEEVPKLPFFETLLESRDYDFSTGFITDPFYRRGRVVLPIIRPITYQYHSTQGGYVFIEVSSDLFSAPLSRYHMADDSNLYLTLGDKHYRYENGDFIAIADTCKNKQDISDTTVTEHILINKVDDGEGKRIVVTAPLDMPGCYISQTISHEESSHQLAILIRVLLGTLIGILTIGTLLMYMMNRMITIPISKLRDKMLHISHGDFSRDSSIEWEHELGDIGRGINDLSENVQLLMNRRLKDEKQKKDLEYKMLQSQINPHFLYNTLNSIKWMATIQGAEGISEMTTALSRLLKSISKGTSLLISIREELSLLENYFTIQSYRYGGTISLDIRVTDESLYDCQIIKFTLQPLVENAIFHGIEPKGCAGKISIIVDYECGENSDTSNICIAVTDDGVGMSPQKTLDILVGTSDSSNDFFQEIGVSNVHKRLQYEFGETYGITVESVEHHYTTMYIHIPYRPGPRQKD